MVTRSAVKQRRELLLSLIVVSQSAVVVHPARASSSNPHLLYIELIRRRLHRVHLLTTFHEMVYSLRRRRSVSSVVGRLWQFLTDCEAVERHCMVLYIEFGGSGVVGYNLQDGVVTWVYVAARTPPLTILLSRPG